MLEFIFTVALLGVPLCFALIFMRRDSGSKRVVRKKTKGKADTSECQVLLAALPRLTGQMFKIATGLTNSLFGRVFLGPISIKANHVDMLRDVVIPEQPKFYPLESFEGPAANPDTKLSTFQLEQYLRPPITDQDNFRYYSISDFYHAYRDGKITPLEVAERAVQAIENSDILQPKLRAIVQYNVEEIMAMANASTERWKNQTPLSVFDGIPFCVKEEIMVAGHHHRVGTSFLGQAVSTVDGTVVARMRAAGAVLLGCSNMHELGMGVTGFNEHLHHGSPRNPQNTAYYTGGSSSGSAASVAAGICPFAIGTDGGGSVRVPAAFCGVVGLKPTFGRVSPDGEAPLASSLGHVGQLATSVTDTALLYAAMAGPDVKSEITLHQPPVTLEGFTQTDLSDVKIGVDWNFFRKADNCVVEKCEEAVEYMKRQGAEIVEIHIPEIKEAQVAHLIIILSEMANGLRDEFMNHYENLGLDVRALLAFSAHVTSSDYIQANKQRARSTNFLKDIFQGVDCIVTPTTAITAPPIQPEDFPCGTSDVKININAMRFVTMGNLVGNPCLTLPVGYDEGGLPINLQIMGQWWQENVVLRCGLAAEHFLAQKNQPQIFYPLL